MYNKEMARWPLASNDESVSGSTTRQGYLRAAAKLLAEGWR